MVKNVAIELRNIRKEYILGDTKIAALNGVSIKVNKGEFLSIIGKSGSGKTTLVNHVGCLDRPTSGEIYLDCHKISDLSDNELARIRGKKIGYIFQQFNLIKNLTSIENVEMPMVFQDVEKEEREKIARKILVDLDLGHRTANKPGELSGGQRQRVAIGRALANNPEIILADEPTGNLDSKTGLRVMNILKGLHQKGKTIILVTHDEYLSKYGDRIITLMDGKVIKDVKNKKRL